MAHTTLIPYSITNPSRTPRRRHWRRTTTTIVNSNQKMHITQTVLVHNKPLSPLPDIVNDCQKKSHIDATEIDNHQTNLTCKQIAHSLRIVADQVDQKYCNDERFYDDLHCLTVRLVLHTNQLRTLLCTLWTRSLLPLVLLICKTRCFV